MFFGRKFRNTPNETMKNSDHLSQSPTPGLDGEWCGVGSATLVTSETSLAYTRSLSDANRTQYAHAPVIDFDFPCNLIPSTQPGHCHLYLDRHVTFAQYIGILTAFYEAGMVEHGFLEATKRRGYGAVRTPWTQKPEEDIAS